MIDKLIGIMNITVGNFNLAEVFIVFSVGVCAGAFPVGMVAARTWKKNIGGKNLQR